MSLFVLDTDILTLFQRNPINQLFTPLRPIIQNDAHAHPSPITADAPMTIKVTLSGQSRRWLLICKMFQAPLMNP